MQYTQVKRDSGQHCHKHICSNAGQIQHSQINGDTRKQHCQYKSNDVRQIQYPGQKRSTQHRYKQRSIKTEKYTLEILAWHGRIFLWKKIWALNKNKAKRKAKLKREFDKVEQREPRTILTETNNRCSRMIPFAASPLINDYLTCNAKSELQC